MNPDRLGRFQILREIGKGAMGKVYLAYDSRIHRQVAIKTIALMDSIPPAEAEEARERFLREAQAAGKLIHPNIVTVFDVGEDGGLSFIAMEYVEGETLDLYSRPGCLLPLERVLNITSQACQALDYAHSHHIIHRDIKPENLILMPGDHLKIMDFGLARQPSASMTHKGTILGTPFYMSPEQIAGKPVDGRSDLFSLGVVLYQLLTGERPFSGESVSTILYRILYEKPRAPKIINEKLPVHFNMVLDRALSKDPVERFQSGKDFREGLESYRSTYLHSAPAESPKVLHRVEAPPRPEPETESNLSPEPSPPQRPAVMRPTLLAGHPLKIAFLAATILVAVLFFPTSFGQEEGSGGVGSDWASQGSGAVPPGSRGVDSFRVWVTTDPPGADLFLDGEPLDQESFALSLGDDAEHILLAVSECLKGQQVIRVADRPEAVAMELTPEILKLEVVSKPAGALLFLDGEATDRRTPTQVELDWCRSHRIGLRKEGYYPWKQDYEAVAPKDRIRQELSQAVLRKIPNGYLRVPSPEGYGVEIFEGGRRIGTSGERITLTSGTHNLVLRNERHFVEKGIQIEVPGKRLVEPEIDLPKLGYLTILALPSNCKIYIGARFLDIPPVVDYPIASGSYVIRCEYLPTGEVKEERVEIYPGRQRRISFRFEP